jgi:hypothetical protein
VLEFLNKIWGLGTKREGKDERWREREVKQLKEGTERRKGRNKRRTVESRKKRN